MSRTRRQNPAITEPAVWGTDIKQHTELTESGEKIYKTAVYARLSSEDLCRTKTSALISGGTIENQVLLVQKYIESKPYLKLCGIFTDNGFTGTNLVGVR